MKPSCLLPSCKEPPHCRGLCKKHYQSAQRFCATGKTTWEQLEKQNKVLPKKKESAGQRNTEASKWLLGK